MSATPSASDRVVEEVRGRIRAGQLVPGQRLAEPDLIAALGVSRVTVRDALRRLEADGLVEVARYRGARVRQMSREDITDLNRIRGVLEGHAAARAAQEIDPAGRAALKEVETFWAADQPPDPENYGLYNTRFHDLVVELSGSESMPRFISHTKLAVFRLQFDFLLLSSDRIAKSRIEHGRVVDAILQGDAPGAESAMRDHIETSTQMILGAPMSYFL